MTLRQWYLGMGVAAAALFPLGANAVTVMNLPASLNFVADDTLTIDYAGAEALNGATAGVNGGTCATGGSSPTGCQERDFVVGIVNGISDSAGNLWTSGVKSAANPNGYELAFVLYGTADLSDVTTGTNTKFDSTGATADTSGQTATYSSDKAASKTVTLTGQDGKIHLDLYYIPSNSTFVSLDKGETPCFTAGCSVAGVKTEVAATDRTGFSTVNGISNAAGGGLFAQFTFASGLKPLNAVDGASNGAVTLSGNFDTSGPSASNAYMTCNVSGPTTPPGCNNFQPITEAEMDGRTGYTGSDATYALDIVNGFLANQIKTATTAPGGGEAGAGYTFDNHDPVYAATEVPEPASLGLLGTGLALFGVAIGRRRRKGIAA